MPLIHRKKKRLVLAFCKIFIWEAAIFLVICLVSCGGVSSASPSTAGPTAGMTSVACAGGLPAGCHIRLLVFSKTAAFRHASIPDAIAALRMLAIDHHVSIDFTENAAIFNDANLSHYAAVVFLLTTGNVLDAEQQAAFERYIEHGGGFCRRAFRQRHRL